MEAAMETLQDKYEFLVSWEPFLLRPEMPAEGIKKPPATPDNPRVGVHLKQAGESVGIDFTGKSDVTPNTLPAHALLDHTKEKYGAQKQNELAEVLFQAYFTDGIPLDANNLSKLAQKVGLDKSETKRVASDQGKIDEVREKARDWKRKGCSGVPLFLMNGQRTFSGARDADDFKKMFVKIAENYPQSD